MHVTLLRRASRLRAVCNTKAPTSRLQPTRLLATWNRPAKGKKETVSEGTSFGIYQQLNEFSAELDLQDEKFKENRGEQGTLIDIEGKTACVLGLDNANIWGLVQFERSGLLGLVVAIEKDIVRIAPLGNISSLKRTDIVRMSNNKSKSTSSPEKHCVDEKLLSLLSPNPPENVSQLELFAKPVSFVQLEHVAKPWHSGVKLVDILNPLRVGGRVGVVGQVGTGKRQFIRDIISNSMDSVPRTVDHCVWVTLGGNLPAGISSNNTTDNSKWTILNSQFKLQENQVVKYLTPFVAVALARQRMMQGEHVVVVIDNVAAHGQAAEEVLGPAVPAQPIAEVLEHFGQLNEQHGGGSMSSFVILDSDASPQSDRAVDLLGTLVDDCYHFGAEQSQKRLVPSMDFSAKGLEHAGAGQPSTLRPLAWKLQRLVFDVSRKVQNAKAAELLGLKAEYEPESMDAIDYYATLEQYFTQRHDLRSNRLASPLLSQGELVISLYMAANGYLEGISSDKVVEFEAEVLRQCREAESGDSLVDQAAANVGISDTSQVKLQHILAKCKEQFVLQSNGRIQER